MPRRTWFALLALFILLGSAGAALAGGEKNESHDDDDKGRSGGEPKANERGGRDGDRHEDGDDDDDRKHGRPGFTKHGDKWLFHNDQIAIQFKQSGNGKVSPDFRVLINGTDGNTSGYRVKILRLYEADNGSTQFRGSFPNMNLAKRADWNVQTETDNESLTLTMIRATAQGIVTLTWHVNTTSAEVKYDLDVENWKWAADAEGHRLVLDMLVLGKNLKNETGARVSVGDAGYIGWDTASYAKYADGSNATLAVTAVQKGADKDDEDEDDDDNEDGGSNSHLLLVFEGPSGYSSMAYDPVFGVQSAGEPRSVPAPATMLIIGVIGIAAVVLGRRK